eukprot:m.200100 g.200100  ORF g.200100 m.200100 type:complete len:134 (-) comp53813_c0_seq2:145-546(-)
MHCRRDTNVFLPPQARASIKAATSECSPMKKSASPQQSASQAATNPKICRKPYTHTGGGSRAFQNLQVEHFRSLCACRAALLISCLSDIIQASGLYPSSLWKRCNKLSTKLLPSSFHTVTSNKQEDQNHSSST